MNKVILMGRLTRDPEVRYSQSATPMAIARYSLAVDRRFKREGEPTADFINCVAFGKTGEFAEKFLKKGTKVNVVGSIRTGSYEKDGRTVYTTDVVVEEHYFAESRNAEQSYNANDSAPVKASKPAKAKNDMPEDFSTFEETVDDDLPF